MIEVPLVRSFEFDPGFRLQGYLVYPTDNESQASSTHRRAELLVLNEKEQLFRSQDGQGWLGEWASVPLLLRGQAL